MRQKKIENIIKLRWALFSKFKFPQDGKSFENEAFKISIEQKKGYKRIAITMNPNLVTFEQDSKSHT